MKKLKTQVMREVWESPGLFYKAPIVLVVVVVLLSLMSFYSLDQSNVSEWTLGASTDRWRLDSQSASSAQSAQVVEPIIEKIAYGRYLIFALFGVVCLFNSMSYAFSALLADRKDRSVLFFKSLPLSEWQVVLVKLGVSVFLIPLFYWGLSLVAVAAYTLVADIFVFHALGVEFGYVVQQVPVIKTLLGGALGVVMTALWALPLYSLLLLFSAWSKKSPLGLLGAVLLVIWVLEKWFLGTHYLGDSLRLYFSGLEIVGQISFVPVNSQEPLAHAWRILVSPGLYLGLIVSAACVLLAVRLRNRRFEI
ncbi:hypothetical protein [Gilvimarinus sp. 1_MG-2023]|uniref:hypothetical protein n=1 Tax=Gilvimarinus sp. 1_MG-2023 TaxID=3062638 RepID=UPI0026E3E035|nr:hypothetical protein [Gilvimarinus sp. 1_MG-2023]MDO6747985.1 hypothetical protein [Gilvimarinus sp. 1_MG-2023]